MYLILLNSGRTQCCVCVGQGVAVYGLCASVGSRITSLTCGVIPEKEDCQDEKQQHEYGNIIK